MAPEQPDFVSPSTLSEADTALADHLRHYGRFAYLGTGEALPDVATPPPKGFLEALGDIYNATQPLFSEANPTHVQLREMLSSARTLRSEWE